MNKLVFSACNERCLHISVYRQVSNGDLVEAVAYLTEKNAKVPQQDEATYYQTAQITNDRYISVGSQADTSTYLNLWTMIGQNPEGRLHCSAVQDNQMLWRKEAAVKASGNFWAALKEFGLYFDKWEFRNDL